MRRGLACGAGGGGAGYNGGATTLVSDGGGCYITLLSMSVVKQSGFSLFAL